MIERLQSNLRVGRHWAKGILLFIGMITAAWASWYMTMRGFSYREVIVLLTLAGALTVLVKGANGIRTGLLLWVFTLGLGYRTADITPYLRIHPSEVLLWFLLFVLFLQWRFFRRRRIEFELPRWVWLFAPFWAWGWIPGLAAGRPWDQMFAEFKNFLALIPLFLIVKAVLREERNWRPLLSAFFITGTWIAGMGVLEYVFPEVKDIFPGFVSDPLPTLTAEGFARARFSFWGTPAATMVIVLTVPMGLVLWREATPRARVAILSAAILQIIGVYIGGYRSMWLLLALETVLWASFWFGYFRGGLLLVPFVAGYHFLPPVAQERVLSGILAIERHPIDSSALKRWNRLTSALQRAFEHPSGIGWAGSGWVHSDFAQVTANLSVIAGVVFLGAYSYTLHRLCQRYLREREVLGLSLMLAFLAAGGELAIEGVEVLPQLFFPVLFVWVCVEVYLRASPAVLEVNRE